MKLELEDSFRKRAWVAMAWDARTRKSCWEFEERDDFDEPTFYLTSRGVYCVSGENSDEDRCRWLEIKDGKGEWCTYQDVAHLVSAGKSKPTHRVRQATEHTMHFCYECKDTFVSPKGTEPYSELVDWEDEDKPIYEPFCESCVKEREWRRANHHHECSYCEEVIRFIEQPRGPNCHLCQMLMNPADVKDWSALTCFSCSNKSNHTEDEWWQA